MATAEEMMESLLSGDQRDPPPLTSPRMLKRDAKIRMLNMMKREHLREVMYELPEPGCSYHLISNGKFDFWSFVPTLVAWLGNCAEEAWLSTWTISRANGNELLALLDEKKIGRLVFLSGEEFRSRETAVFGTLYNGLKVRGHDLIIAANHAKVVLLRHADQHLIVEGSANLTGNPRIEQYVISADPELYEFHRAWMDELRCAHKNKSVNG